jgi:peroxiredoxin
MSTTTANHRAGSDKRARRAAAKLARQEAARRAARRRRIRTYGVPSAIVLAIIAVGVLLVSQRQTGGRPAAAGTVTAAAAERTVPLSIGDRIPDFSAPGLGAERVSWSDFRGSPTILAVWAPWCPSCQKELPILGRMARGFPGVQVGTVVTSIGYRPGPAPAAFMDDNGLSFPTAVDDEARTLGKALGVNAFPTLYAVAADGRVVEATQGEIGEAGIRALFSRLSGQ